MFPHGEYQSFQDCSFPDNCLYINTVTSTNTRNNGRHETSHVWKIGTRNITPTPIMKCQSSVLLILFSLQSTGCPGFMGMNDFSREENMQKIFDERDNIEEEDEEESKEDTIREKAEAIINNHNDNNNSNHTEEKVECFTSFICLNLVKITSSKLN